jgi:hypothetical protein
MLVIQYGSIVVDHSPSLPRLLRHEVGKGEEVTTFHPHLNVYTNSTNEMKTYKTRLWLTTGVKNRGE